MIQRLFAAVQISMTAALCTLESFDAPSFRCIARQRARPAPEPLQRQGRVEEANAIYKRLSSNLPEAQKQADLLLSGK